MDVHEGVQTHKYCVFTGGGYGMLEGGDKYGKSGAGGYGGTVIGGGEKHRTVFGGGMEKTL